MVARADVVQAAVALTLERGSAPSTAEVARAVGLTKQGVLHHFPSRAALDEAVLRSALARVDAEMSEAARHGRAAETYLRLAAHGQAATDWLASALDKALAEPLSARSRGRHGEAG